MKFLSAVKNIFRTYLVAGLAVTIPLIGTFLILRWIILFSDEFVTSMLPNSMRPEEIFGVSIPGVGLAATFMIVLISGFATKLYLGRKLMQIGDYLISKIPLGRSIYAGIKQFMTTILTRDKSRFKGVVAIDFPRVGCRTIGLVTGNAIPGIANDSRRWVNVLVPTTPNPTSGYLIMVPENDLSPLDISIDEAFKIIISCGVVGDEIRDRKEA